MNATSSVNLIQASSDSDNKQKLKQIYQSKFNSGQPVSDDDITTVCAPGRVNLIGGHTDYCHGLVLPLAIDLKTYVLGALNGSPSKICVYTNAEQIPEDSRLIELDLKNLSVFSSDSPKKWCNFVIGVIKCFHNQKILQGFNLAIHSEIPLGGGLSSSASLEVAVYTFLEELFLDTAPNVIYKALQCQKAENIYGKIPCGIMDQLICSIAKIGHLTMIDCQDLENSEYIAIPDYEICFLVTNSNVKHELSGTEYSDRRSATERAAKICQEPTLRTVTQETLVKKRDLIDEVTFKRARHVVDEIVRVKRCAASLKVGDYSAVGKYMFESHKSLSEKYDVSCREQDKLVQIVSKLEVILEN